jgi:hypothetical protein
MSRINKKPISFGLKALFILIFSILIIPAIASADSVYSGQSVNQTPPLVDNNTWQIINSISPSSANRSIDTENVIITGDGFQPTSIARVNGSDRSTTFIDNSHLSVRLNPNDTYRTDGGFYITVFNEASGNGSYSNSAFFTVNYDASSVNSNNNDNSSSNATQTENTSTDNSSDLASSAIFGTNSLLPSGLIQWILFAILILVIVILARKIFGGKERYNETPMKHE